jgi:predicted amidohydrolase YtcJ
MESLYAYTAGGAWAAQMDHITGRLVAGLAADLVLIEGDIEAIPADRIGDTGIALTVCGGKITHRGARFA